MEQVKKLSHATFVLLILDINHFKADEEHMQSAIKAAHKLSRRKRQVKF
jgi:hypothetical protein